MTIAMDLSWAQRDEISLLLYKGLWRDAVKLIPEEARELFSTMCQDCKLAEIAAIFDPRSDGVIVDAADWHPTTHHEPF
jgi:hypothetical protein